MNSQLIKKEGTKRTMQQTFDVMLPIFFHFGTLLMLRVSFQVDLIFNEEGSCPLCSKTFSRKSSLITHIRNHSAERKYICSYCQKRFTQAANLRNHERIHTNDRPYVCGDCGKAFTQVSILLFIWSTCCFQVRHVMIIIV